MSPVTTASFAEMAWLREVVVVIVTELSVCRVTAWAPEVFRFRRRGTNLGRLRWSLNACLRRHCVVLYPAHNLFDEMSQRSCVYSDEMKKWVMERREEGVCFFKGEVWGFMEGGGGKRDSGRHN